MFVNVYQLESNRASAKRFPHASLNFTRTALTTDLESKVPLEISLDVFAAWRISITGQLRFGENKLIGNHPLGEK